MRICCIEHVPFEGPAGIASWCHSRGHTLFEVQAWRAPLPAAEDHEALVIMGGSMSVHDEREHRFLSPEKRLLAAYLDAGKPVLGVCLGAQLIADVLGARVYRGPAPEIGWWPVRRVAGSAAALTHAPMEFVPFHWHAETFELPRGAQRLLESAACENQGFQLGSRVLGLQCHLEATPDSVRELVTHAGADIGAGRWEEPAASILERANERVAGLEPVLFSVLDELTRGLG